MPEKITTDGSAANESAIKSYNKEHGTLIEIRQIKYLNNIVEQDHRGVKRVTRPMLGFESFEVAQSTLTGIELMHKLRQGQLEGNEMEGLSAVEQFCKLAALSPHRWAGTRPQASSEQNLRQSPYTRNRSLSTQEITLG